MLVSYAELKAEFQRVLLSRDLSSSVAEACAELFAHTTASGILSHGINRFPRFIQQLDQGDINPNAQPEKCLSFGALEQWDAHQGIGNLCARQMMRRAMEVADRFGIGVVALRNANHWMRGGSYGELAAEQGYIGICWSNSISVMPPWGAKECRIGTNPLTVAVPGEPVTLMDMSMSMFSYGMLEVNRLAGRQLPIDGGFDDQGNPTRDPEVIQKNRRILPMGYWKGSGLSIVLDMIVTLLSGGLSVAEITEEQSDETRVSQIFIAIDPERMMEGKNRQQKLQRIIEYVRTAAAQDPQQPVRLPGHSLAQRRQASRQHGMVVDDGVWAQINAL